MSRTPIAPTGRCVNRRLEFADIMVFIYLLILLRTREPSNFSAPNEQERYSFITSFFPLFLYKGQLLVHLVPCSTLPDCCALHIYLIHAQLHKIHGVPDKRQSYRIQLLDIKAENCTYRYIKTHTSSV